MSLVKEPSHYTDGAIAVDTGYNDSCHISMVMKVQNRRYEHPVVDFVASCK